MWAEWKRLVAAGKLTGLRLHDAYIAAVMKGHSIANILTLNGKDFDCFQEIEPFTPDKWKEIA